MPIRCLYPSPYPSPYPIFQRHTLYQSELAQARPSNPRDQIPASKPGQQTLNPKTLDDSVGPGTENPGSKPGPLKPIRYKL
jgi:hypothetical protein